MFNQKAHYLITHVRYNSERTYISHVEVGADLGSQIGQMTTWSRQQVVASLGQGYSFMTAPPSSSGGYNRGDYVRTYTVNGRSYLRTDGNSRASDNLGNLPEF